MKDRSPQPLPPQTAHLIALGQMLIVTLLWSSSFPIHKMLMNEGMPPLSLAGYRYFSASIILLLAVKLRDRGKPRDKPPPRSSASIRWFIVAVIGIFMYTAQGVHLTALSLISASDSGLVVMTSMPVAVAALAFLTEKHPPTRVQLIGLGIILFGIYIYFPHDIMGARLTGVLLNVLSSVLGAIAIVLTHIAVNRLGITSLNLTAFSMTVGSSILFVFALAHDRFFIPNTGQMLWIAFLAIVNTSFAFALFNHTLKTLGAFEVTVLQDSMIIQIGILSAIFLGEAITPAMALGMFVVICGIVLVQYFAPGRRYSDESVGA
jgi:drug/metabolite transporter (DMT)-like permease